MSGLGAPLRTAKPIDERTRSTWLPGTTLPCATSASRAGRARITMSTGSPRASRLGIESLAAPIEAP